MGLHTTYTNGESKMKTKHYIKLLAPISIFGFIFRILEIVFAIEPDTGYFVQGSVIPIIFNVYLILAVLFFMSIVFTTKTEQKPVKNKFVKFSFKDNLATMLSAVFILSSSMQIFLNKYFIDGLLDDYRALFRDISFYMIVAALLSALFLVQFATSPKLVCKSGFFTVLSLFVPIYYVLRLFIVFTDMSNIISHSYGTYTIVFLSFITLAFLNLSKVLAGSLCRKQLMAFSLCAVFMGAIHLAEFVMAFIPGNPYNISIDLLTYLADLFICLMLIMIFLKVSKKVKTAKAKENSKEIEPSEDAETQEEEIVSEKQEETTPVTVAKEEPKDNDIKEEPSINEKAEEAKDEPKKEIEDIPVKIEGIRIKEESENEEESGDIIIAEAPKKKKK